MESQWRTISRFIRAGLLSSGLGSGAWPYPALQGNTIRNACAREGGKSGYEIMSGHPTKEAIQCKPIGCAAFVLKNDRELNADDVGGATVAPRAWKGINLGMARDSPAFMIYVPELGRVKTSTNVDFDVTDYPLLQPETMARSGVDSELPAWWYDIDASSTEGIQAIYDDPVRVFDSDDDEGGQVPAIPTDDTDDDAGGPDDDSNDGTDDDDDEYGDGAPPPQLAPLPDDYDIDENDVAAPPAAASGGRPVRNRRQAPNANDLHDWGSTHGCALAAACSDMLEQVGAVDMMDMSDMCEQEAGSMLLIETVDSFCIGFRNESALATKVHNAKMAAEVPECAMATKVLSSKDALNGPRAAGHRAAIDKEIYGQMQKFKTYTLIPISDKPGEAKLIDLKLVLAEKFGGSNEFLKAKARLVARGDQMQSGTDYDPFSTTAPSLHYTTLRVLGALAANRDRPLSTSDGTQAYLNATLKAKVFGRLPKELREYTVDGVELIALIVKAIYGLLTSGNAWNQDINAHLTSHTAFGGWHGVAWGSHGDMRIHASTRAATARSGRTSGSPSITASTSKARTSCIWRC